MINQNNLREVLGLDSDLIEHDMNACIASAYYYREMQREASNYQQFSATLLRRAASHALLVMKDVEERDRLFQSAANAYRELQMPYGCMMLAFVKHENVDFSPYVRLLRENLETQDDQIESVLQHIYLLIASVHPRWSRQLAKANAQTREELNPYRQTTIGIPGIVIGDYLDLYDALQSLFNSNINRNVSLSRVRQALQPFITTYNKALERIREDQYHWERLAVPFHPAELDVFAVLLYTHKALKSVLNERISQDFFQYQYLSEQTLLLLEGILSDYIN